MLRTISLAHKIQSRTLLIMSLGNLVDGDEDRPLYNSSTDNLSYGAALWRSMFNPNDPDYRTEESARNKAPVKKKRKPNPQTKLKNFFQQKENDDGYPMKFCAYEPLEERFVYRPPGYGVGGRQTPRHCCSCHLKPCVVDEYRSETNECFFDLQITKKTPGWQAQEKTSVFLHKKYCKAIKRRYLKKLKPPQCIVDRIEGYKEFFSQYDNNDSDTDTDESDSDMEGAHVAGYGVVVNRRGQDGNKEEEEDEHNSSTDEDDDDDCNDDIPLSLLRNHECGDLPLTEKNKLYQLKKTQQETVDQNNKGVKRKSIAEMLEEQESSDEEFEF